jgi:hypothetical protein
VSAEQLRDAERRSLRRLASAGRVERIEGKLKRFGNRLALPIERGVGDRDGIAQRVMLGVVLGLLLEHARPVE